MTRAFVVGYGDAEVLHGVDLRVEAGATVTVVARRQRRRQVHPCARWRRAWSTPPSARCSSRARRYYRRASRPAGLQRRAPRPRAGIFPGLHRGREPHRAPARPDTLRTNAYERFPILLEAAQAGWPASFVQRAADAEPGARPCRPARRAHRRRADARPRTPRGGDAVMEAILEPALRVCRPPRRGARAERAERRRHPGVHGAEHRRTGPWDEADMQLLTSEYLGGGHDRTVPRWSKAFTPPCGKAACVPLSTTIPARTRRAARSGRRAARRSPGRPECVRYAVARGKGIDVGVPAWKADDASTTAT